MPSVLKRVSDSFDLLSRLGPVRLLRMDIDPTDPSSGDYKLRVTLSGDLRLDVYERLVGGRVVKYSYSLIRGEGVLLRYDNAPHHRDLETHPHHRHVRGRVLPLYDHSLSAFLQEVTEFLKGIDSGSSEGE